MRKNGQYIMLLEEEVRRLQLLEDRISDANMRRPTVKLTFSTIGTQTVTQSMRQVSLGGKIPSVFSRPRNYCVHRFVNHLLSFDILPYIEYSLLTGNALL